MDSSDGVCVGLKQSLQTGGVKRIFTVTVHTATLRAQRLIICSYLCCQMFSEAVLCRVCLPALSSQGHSMFK